MCPQSSMQGCGESPQPAPHQADERSEKYYHASVWSSLESIRMYKHSASQMFDLSTRLSTPFFFPFHILVCACWWVVEQQAPPRSPGYEAETAELPIFILAAAWATHHCNSSLIKGINSKFCQSKVRSLNVFTDALNEKCKVWGGATASAVETISPLVASVLVFLKADCQFPEIYPCFLTPSTAKIPVCLPINLFNKCFPTSE